MILKKFIENHNFILIKLGYNMFLISLILLLLDKLSILNVNSILNLNLLSFIGISLGTFSFILWQEKLNDKKKSLYKKIIKFLFLFFLLLITIISLPNLKFLESFTKFLSPAKIFFYLFTILLGVVTFWQNKKVVDELEQEKTKEEEEEERRKKNFSLVHPKMNSIPILKHILKWMYRWGWWYSIGVISLTIFIVLVRLWKVGDVSYWYDELIHIFAARGINLSNILPQFPSGIIYLRGWITSYIIKLTSILTGSETETVIRTPFVFIMLLGILVLSSIFKKYISKKGTLLFLLIISLNVYNIVYSQEARYYAVSILLTTLFLFVLLSNIKDKIKLIILSFIAIIATYNFIPFLIIFMVSLVTYYSKPLRNIKKWYSTKKHWSFVVFICVLVIYVTQRVLIYILKNKTFLESIKASNFYVALFYPLMILLALLSIIFIYNKKIRVIYITTFSYLIIFSFLTNTYFGKTPRYIAIIYPLVIFLAVSTIVYSYRCFTKKPKAKYVSFVICLLISISLISPAFDYFLRPNGHLEWTAKYTWTRPEYKRWSNIEIPPNAIVISDVAHITKFYTNRLDFVVMGNKNVTKDRIVNVPNIKSLQQIRNNCTYAFLDYKKYRWEEIKPEIKDNFDKIDQGRQVLVYRSKNCKKINKENSSQINKTK